MAFPKDFIWGVATAAYQIEGAVNEDGRKPSVWDMFCAKPGAIQMGQNGNTACDHYHRYRDDVAIMKELGIKGYRFSVAWPRVIPDGVGKVNAKGLDFYNRLVDELLSAGIHPWVTLFHWDFPYELYCRGGWLNRDVAEWFADYATVVAKSLGDRVKNWMMLNEPQVTCVEGHQLGVHAPGEKLAANELVRVIHDHLLSHGRGVQAVRAAAKQKASIGVAMSAQVFMPATESAADIDAARARAFPGMVDDFWANGWHLDPVLRGEYPAPFLSNYAPPIQPGDMEIIHQPVDFLGMNIYNGKYIRDGANGPEEVPALDGAPITAFYWPVTPECMRWGPRLAYERYKLPIYITEAGMANIDYVSDDGQCHDPQRIIYLQRYLRQVEKAIADGVDFRGVFLWSLMDNFEWAEGYRQRFGLVHVNYQTQTRTWKDSAKWYKQLIATGGTSLQSQAAPPR